MVTEHLEEYEERNNERLIDHPTHWPLVTLGYCIAAHSSDFATDPEEITLCEIAEPYKSIFRNALKRYFFTLQFPSLERWD